MFKMNDIVLLGAIHPAALKDVVRKIHSLCDALQRARGGTAGNLNEIDESLRNIIAALENNPVPPSAPLPFAVPYPSPLSPNLGEITMTSFL